MNDLYSGTTFLDLILLADDCRNFGGESKHEIWKRVEVFLDNNYQFKASDLFPIQRICTRSASDEELFGLCLLLLITCLQGRAKQTFMDAAVDLDFEAQNVIFHLLREPMTKLSADQHLTQDSVLAGFREPIPSPHSLAVQADAMTNPGSVPNVAAVMLLSDQTGVAESTPIKAVSIASGVRHSSDGFFEDKNAEYSEPYCDILCRSWNTENYIDAIPDPASTSAPNGGHKDGQDCDNNVFRAPEPVILKKVTRSTATSSAVPDSDPQPKEMLSQSVEREAIPNSYSPAFQRRFPTAGNAVMFQSSQSKRPSDLPIHHFNMPNHHMDYQCSLAQSGTTSLGDLSDLSIAHKQQTQQTLPSPMTSLKHLLDSPMWVQKTRLRETERERRRLVGELEKERNYRDEVENVVAELRTQLDEARLRATEAEAKATRMSRDLTALQDQADELSVCRAELALRDDTIASLKQRLNSFQDLMSHSRKLELENANLQQECADHKQKVEQLSAKLSEIKDRRMMCTEMETLRSKLSDVEAQLAQQILERVNAEKDARRQQELYSQLKIQQSLAEKRRALNIGRRKTLAGCSPSTLSLPGQQNSLQSTVGSVNDIEFEASRLNSSRSAENGLSKTVAGDGDMKLIDRLQSGENLGSVLETDLRSAHTHISRLQVELSEALDQLSIRDNEVEQLTERVKQLTADLSTLSLQREITEETIKQLQTDHDIFQSDLSTLEGRILWTRLVDEDSSGHLSPRSLLAVQSHGLEQLRTVGTGLSESLNKLCHLLVDRFEDVLHLQENSTKQITDQLIEFRNNVKLLKDANQSLENELKENKIQLKQYLAENQRLKDEQQSAVASLEMENRNLVDQLHAKSTIIHDQAELIQRLDSDKHHLEEFLTKLKTQTDVELCSSKDLLEKATQRLQELEAQLLAHNQSISQLDACVQTHSSLAELPLVVTASHLHESLENLDVDISPNAVDEDLSPQCDVSNTAYEASAADRRGLSDELVRLHSALDEAHRYAQELEQHNNDLLEKLESMESALQQQTALFTHAQENWALTEGQLRNARAKHAAELDSLRGELIPQINQLRTDSANVANQMVTVQAEKEDLQRRLSTTISELSKVTCERNNLVERCTDLQRELITTQHLVETMAISSRKSRNADGSITALKCRSPQSQTNGSVEEWVEASRLHSAWKQRCNDPPCAEAVTPHNGYLNEVSNSSECLSCVSPEHFTSGYNAYRPKSRRQGSARSSKKRHSDHLTETLARLANRTAMLESVALQLSQQSEQLAAQRTDLASGQRSSVPVASSTLCSLNQQPSFSGVVHSLNVCNAHPVTQLDGGQIPVSAPVAYPTSGNTAIKDELDTDADSSALTDLDQVSSVSRNERVDQAATFPHSSPVSANLSQFSNSQGPYKSDPVQSTRVIRTDEIRGPFNEARFSSRADSLPMHGNCTSPRKTSHEQDVSDRLDPNRINELHRRNRLQPLHLRTSYPVETQAVEPEHVAGALAHLTSNGQRKRNHPKQSLRNASGALSTVPEDHRTVLREVDKDNLETSRRKSCQGSSSVVSQSHERLKLQKDDRLTSELDSPLAAGYRPFPKNIQAITDALIAASYDPSAMAEALSAEISKVSLLTRNSSRSCDNNPSNACVQSARPHIQRESSDITDVPRRVIQSARLTYPNTSPSKQSHFIDENVNPPTLSLPVSINGASSSDQFVRPAPPPPRVVHRDSGEDSEDSLSVASSIRSNKSSIAFEIPNEAATVKVRRLPAARRPLPTATAGRSGSAVVTKGKAQPAVMNCAQLSLETSLATTAETPIQRNTRLIKESSGICR